MADYTIEAVSPKQRNWQAHGKDFISYYVRFRGDEDPVEISKLADSPAPKEGDVVYGNVTENAYGKKFKSEKKPFGGRPDNSDGMRQGMCFNNAAAYVTEKSDKKLSPQEWADAVFAYAEALYTKGDLVKKEVSGYDKFKASRPQPDKVAPVPDEDAEVASMIAKGLEADDIDLEGIPF